MCRFDASQYIDDLLVKQISAFIEKGHFDQKAFEEYYTLLENFFYNQAVDLLAISLLQGVRVRY